MSALVDNNPWYDSGPVLIIPHIVTGIIAFSIAVIVICPLLAQSANPAPYFCAAKWMAVSLACIVALKLLKDAYAAYQDSLKEGAREGLRRFAFEGALTVGVPVAASIFAAFSLFKHPIH